MTLLLILSTATLVALLCFMAFVFWSVKSNNEQANENSENNSESTENIPFPIFNDVINIIRRTEKFNDYALIHKVTTNLYEYNYNLFTKQDYALVSKAGEKVDIDLDYARQLNCFLPVHVVIDDNDSDVQYMDSTLLKLTVLDKALERVGAGLGVERMVNISQIITDLENNPGE